MLVAAQYSKTQRREVTTYYVSTRERGALHCSIQQAIDKAEPFSRIVIAAGQYFETITVTQPIELVGEDGDAPEICSRGVCISVAADVECLFENLTIVSKAPAPRTIFSRDLHAAVRIIKGKPTFYKCKMTSVYVGGYSYPCIQNCTISGNIAGCGLIVAEEADGEYLQNSITNHIPYCVLVKSRGTPVFTENTIYQEPKIIQAMLTSAPQLPRGGGAILISPDGGNVDSDKSISPKFVNNRIGDEVIPSSTSLSSLTKWYPRLAHKITPTRSATATRSAGFTVPARSQRTSSSPLRRPPKGDKKGRGHVEGEASQTHLPQSLRRASSVSTSSNASAFGGSRSPAKVGGTYPPALDEKSYSALAERELALQNQLCERETVKVDFGCSPFFDDNHITGGHVSVSVCVGGAGVFTNNQISHGSIFGINLHPFSSPTFKNNVITQCATGALLVAANASLSSNTINESVGAGCVIFTAPKTRCYMNGNSFVANDVGIIAHELSKPLKGLGGIGLGAGSDNAGNGAKVTMSLPAAVVRDGGEVGAPPSPQQMGLSAKQRVADHSPSAKAGSSPATTPVKVEEEEAPLVEATNDEDLTKADSSDEANKNGPSAQLTASTISKGMISLNRSCGALLVGSLLDFVLEDVSIGANGPLGVIVALGANPSIIRCHFDRGPIGLLLCERGNPTVTDCRFESHTESAVSVEDHGRGTFRGCDFRSFSKNGIRICDAGQPLVNENNFTAVGGVGIDVSSGGIGTITSNTFNTVFRGIVISTFGDPVVTDNKVRAASDVGILVHNEGCGTIVGNRVSECAVGIASLTGGEASIRDNNVVQAGKWGIYCGEGSLSVIEKNRVTESYAVNMMVEGADNRSLIRGNVFDGSRTIGIRLAKGAMATITKNKTRNDGSVGILSEYGDRCVVSHNTVEFCLGNGIAIGSGGGSTFIQNEVHNGSHNGIYLAEGSSATIRSCTIRDNEGTGVVVEQGSGGVLKDSIVHDNKKHGVEFVPSTSAGASVNPASLSSNDSLTTNKQHKANLAVHGSKNEPEDLLAQSFNKKLKEYIANQKATAADNEDTKTKYPRRKSTTFLASSGSMSDPNSLVDISGLEIYSNGSSGMYVGAGCVGRASKCTIKRHSAFTSRSFDFINGRLSPARTKTLSKSRNLLDQSLSIETPRILWENMPRGVADHLSHSTHESDLGAKYDDLSSLNKKANSVAVERGGIRTDRDHRLSEKAIDTRVGYSPTSTGEMGKSESGASGKKFETLYARVEVGSGGQVATFESDESLTGKRRALLVVGDEVGLGAVPTASHEQFKNREKYENLPIVSVNINQKWSTGIYCLGSRPETRFAECIISENDVGVLAGEHAKGCLFHSWLNRNTFSDIVLGNESDLKAEDCNFGRLPATDEATALLPQPAQSEKRWSTFVPITDRTASLSMSSAAESAANINTLNMSGSTASSAVIFDSAAAIVAVGNSAGKVIGCSLSGPFVTAAVIIVGNSTVVVEDTKVATYDALHIVVPNSTNATGKNGKRKYSPAKFTTPSPLAPLHGGHALSSVGLICDGPCAPTVSNCIFARAEKANTILGRRTTAKIESSTFSESLFGVGAVILGPHSRFARNNVENNTREGIVYASMWIAKRPSPTHPDEENTTSTGEAEAETRLRNLGTPELSRVPLPSPPSSPPDSAVDTCTKMTAASLNQMNHLTKNTIRQNGGEAGIVCIPFAIGAIFDNVVSENTQCGVKVLEDCTVVIEGCTIAENAKCGLIFSNFACGIGHNNEITGNGIANVVLEEGAEGSLISNTISSGSADGLYCAQNVSTAITKNTIVGHEKGNGVVIDGPSPNLTIKNNSIFSNNVGLYTVPRSGSLAIVEGNTFSHNTICGVIFEEHSAISLVNNVFKIASCCVQLRTLARGTVKGNTFINSNEAIAIFGSLVATDCQENLFSKNGVGFALRGSDTHYKLKNNVFGPHEFAAVLVEGKATSIITNNVFHNRSEEDAAVGGTNNPPPVPNNARSGGRGILVKDSSRPWVLNNTFEGVSVGIEVDGASCVVDKCLFVRCGQGLVICGNIPSFSLPPRPSGFRAGAGGYTYLEESSKMTDAEVRILTSSPSVKATPAVRTIINERLLVVDSIFYANVQAGITLRSVASLKSKLSPRHGVFVRSRSDDELVSTPSVYPRSHETAEMSDQNSDDPSTRAAAGIHITRNIFAKHTAAKSDGNSKSTPVSTQFSSAAVFANPKTKVTQPDAAESHTQHQRTQLQNFNAVAITCEPFSPYFSAEENIFGENTVAIAMSDRNTPTIARNMFYDNEVAAVLCKNEGCRPSIRECAFVGNKITSIISAESACPAISRCVFREGAGTYESFSTTSANSQSSSVETTSLKPSTVGAILFFGKGGGSVVECLFRCCSSSIVFDGAYNANVSNNRMVTGGCAIVARGNPSRATVVDSNLISGHEVGFGLGPRGLISRIRNCLVVESDIGFLGSEEGQCDDVSSTAFLKSSKHGILIRGLGRYEFKECVVAECTSMGISINNKTPAPTPSRCSSDPFGVSYGTSTSALSAFLSVNTSHSIRRLASNAVVGGGGGSSSGASSQATMDVGSDAKSHMSELIHGLSSASQQQQHHTVAFATIAPDTYKIAHEDTIRRSPFTFARYVAFFERCQIRDNRYGLTIVGGFAAFQSNLIFGNEVGMNIGTAASQAFSITMTKNACFDSARQGATMHIYNSPSQISATANQFYSPREGALEVFTKLGQQEAARQLPGNETLNNCAYKQQIPTSSAPSAGDSDKLFDRSVVARCDELLPTLSPIFVALFADVPQSMRVVISDPHAPPSEAKGVPRAGMAPQPPPERGHDVFSRQRSATGNAKGSKRDGAISTFFCPRLVSPAAKGAPIPRGRSDADKSQTSETSIKAIPSPPAVALRASPVTANPRADIPSFGSAASPSSVSLTQRIPTADRASARILPAVKNTSTKPQKQSSSPSARNRSASATSGNTTAAILPVISPRKPSRSQSMSPRRKSKGKDKTQKNM